MAKKGLKIKPVVLLDAGHGKETAGKRSPVWPDGTQYFEWEGNRDIRDRVAKKLDEAGHSDRYKYVWHGEEDLSLTNRVKVVNDFCKHYGSQNCFLLSIHSDAFTSSAAHGWGQWIAPNASEKSQNYAELIKEEVKNIFNSNHVRPTKRAKFTMVTKTKCPAVLTECFFMTNQADCKQILMTERGKDMIATVLANVLIKIIERK